MKKGFELLTTRTLENKIDIEELENKYNIKLPPCYRLFVESFILGENNIKEERAFDSCNPYGYQIQGCTYLPNNDASITHFNEIEKVLTLSQKGEIELWREYLPIAAPGFNGAIVVAINGNDKDKIFLHDWERTPELTLLASNIFEYVRGMFLIDNLFNIGKKVPIEKLYKNWEEDFWRIREDKA
ncbi:MAG: SMI1/KNR4 family protein [Saprospiraceae bacterium]|nr:SMI1/KNR4 family protein [Saprospiraceae bacterium]